MEIDELKKQYEE